MVLRQSLIRHAARPLSSTSRRGLATTPSGTFQYQQGNASGVKIASRDLAGPTSTLALVAKAGTRYQPLPGLADALTKYAFLNTEKRSGLRLQREAELFGATYFSYHTRENVVIGAKFFRDDLPYFVEALAEVATQTRFLPYEFQEHVMHHIHLDKVKILADTKEFALSSAHGVAFHRGLGEPVLPTSSVPLTKYLSHEAIGAYSTLAYRKPNVALVGNGVEHSELNKWASEYFKDMRTEAIQGTPPIEHEQSKYYGGEERIAHASGNTMVLAFPGSSSLTGGFYKPEIAVLATLLGGRSSIKWSSGFSALGKIARQHPGLEVETKSAIYSDAGLLYIRLHGSAPSVREGAYEAVKVIKELASGKINTEDFKKARALAQFRELEHGQEILAGLELTGSGLIQDGKPYQLDDSAKKIGEVTEDQVKKAAAAFLEYKASVSTVGDLFQLPFAEELGLSV